MTILGQELRQIFSLIGRPDRRASVDRSSNRQNKYPTTGSSVASAKASLYHLRSNSLPTAGIANATTADQLPEPTPAMKPEWAVE